MRIVEQYSHLNGYEFLQVHQPKLWREIVAVITKVDAAAYRTKVSKEKTMPGRMLYDPRALNTAMCDEFRLRKWEERRAAFYVTRDAKLIRKTLNMSPAEQKKEIEDAGEVAVRSYNQTDFVKDRIAVEVQFGNISRSHTTCSSSIWHFTSAT